MDNKINEIAISKNGFVFDPSSGNSYRTNELGFFIFDQLKNEKTTPEIVKLICETYEVGEKQAENDTIEFLKELKKLHLLNN